jgi:hypothetical protein
VTKALKFLSLFLLFAIWLANRPNDLEGAKLEGEVKAIHGELLTLRTYSSYRSSGVGEARTVKFKSSFLVPKARDLVTVTVVERGGSLVSKQVSRSMIEAYFYMLLLAASVILALTASWQILNYLAHFFKRHFGPKSE